VTPGVARCSRQKTNAALPNASRSVPSRRSHFVSMMAMTSSLGVRERRWRFRGDIPPQLNEQDHGYRTSSGPQTVTQW
jgi:hypothetical protein